VSEIIRTHILKGKINFTRGRERRRSERQGWWAVLWWPFAVVIVCRYTIIIKYK
jgi:hypothetical protein